MYRFELSETLNSLFMVNKKEDIKSSFLMSHFYLNGLIKSITIVDISRFQTGFKPFHALLAAAMSKTIGYHLPGRTFL